MEIHLIRAFMFYEWLLEHSRKEALENINKACGNVSVSKSNIRYWFLRFDSGDRTLEDEPRSGRPVELENAAVRQALKRKPSAPLRELGQDFGVHHSTVAEHLYSMQCRRVLSQRVPHKLTDGNKATRRTICQALLTRPHRRKFLSTMITGDESYILFNNTYREAYWLKDGVDPPLQPTVGRFARKCLLCVWFYAGGIVYWELLMNKTVDSEVYCEQMRKVDEKIQEIFPNAEEKLMLHDNARPHTSNVTSAELERLQIETLPHPPYSPDIAPADFHLFRPLKAALCGREFNNVDEVKTAASAFFESQTADFWKKPFNDLPGRWQKVCDHDGDYFKE